VNESVTLNASGAQSYTWSTNDIGSAIFVAPASDITYTVAGENASGCTDEVVHAITVESCLGLKNTSSATNISLYPNPVLDDLYLVHENTSGELTYVIMNSLGQEVQRGSASGKDTKISVNHLDAGMYNFTLVDRNGFVIRSLRIIKN
jgi:hypothetical protein